MLARHWSKPKSHDLFRLVVSYCESVVFTRTGGGGGWGDPLEREATRVRDDVLNEFVSVARGKLRLLREPFVGRGSDDDESVFDFVARRFGPEAAERAAGPALIGVYAGDAAALSVRAAFPRLAKSLP